MKFTKCFSLFFAMLFFWSGVSVGMEKKGKIDYGSLITRAKTIEDLNKVFEEADDGRYKRAYAKQVGKIINLGQAKRLFEKLKKESDFESANKIRKELEGINKKINKHLSKVKDLKLAQKKINDLKNIFADAKIRKTPSQLFVEPVPEEVQSRGESYIETPEEWTLFEEFIKEKGLGEDPKEKDKKKIKKLNEGVVKPVKIVDVLVYDDGKPKAFEFNLKKAIKNKSGKLNYTPALSFKWISDFEKLSEKADKNPKGLYHIVFYVNTGSNLPIEDVTGQQMPILLKLSEMKTAIVNQFYNPDAKVGFKRVEITRDLLTDEVKKKKYISGRSLKLSRELGIAKSGKFDAFSFPTDNESEKVFHSNPKYNKLAQKEMDRLAKFLIPVIEKIK